MSATGYVIFVRNSHSALWMVTIGVINTMNRVTKELRAAIDDTIVEYKEVFNDCTNDDIVEALRQVMEDYK